MPQKASGHPFSLPSVCPVRHFARKTGRERKLWAMMLMRRRRNEFHRNTGVDKRDFAAIEFLLRKGRRQLEVYAAAGVKDVKA